MNREAVAAVVDTATYRYDDFSERVQAPAGSMAHRAAAAEPVVAPFGDCWTMSYRISRRKWNSTKPRGITIFGNAVSRRMTPTCQSALFSGNRFIDRGRADAIGVKSPGTYVYSQVYSDSAYDESVHAAKVGGTWDRSHNSISIRNRRSLMSIKSPGWFDEPFADRPSCRPIWFRK